MKLHVGSADRSKVKRREAVDQSRKAARDNQLSTIRQVEESLTSLVPSNLVFTDSDLIFTRTLVHYHCLSIENNPFSEEELRGARTDLLGIVNLLEGVVRRISAFAKLNTYFSPLSVEDQVNLLKGGAMEIMLTRLVMPAFRRCVPGEGIVWYDNGKNVIITEKAVERIMGKAITYSPYAKSLLQLNLDDTALIMLTCILLFWPGRTGLRDAANVNMTQNILLRLFYRYLIHVTGHEQAVILYNSALSSAAKASMTAGVFEKYIVQLPKQDVRPILHEYFDLK
jgi:hypothetical protein